MRSRTLALAVVALSLAPAAVAHADGDPIMPLADVHRGMHCTAYSVIHGTDVSSFDADVLDVIQGDPAAGQPFILVKVSGPAVADTGIGPGFSGSPIYCADGAGVDRVIGAISEGIGEYGNTTALATPIELVVGTPVDLPAETRTDPALVARARHLSTPLSVGGLSPRVATLVSRAAARANRVVYATPAAPRQSEFPAQALRPGSAMAVGLASGDFTAGAIGTVAYVDGDRVWAFGHPLDSAGRRSLFLEDAYVYDVVNNPVGSPDLTTYKYAAAGHDLGTLTTDGSSAVTGRLGVMPRSFPLRIAATDVDSGKVRRALINVADEADLGLPTGTSSLTQIGGIALAQMAFETLDGIPRRQSGEMCVRITVAERPTPLRFCNTYVGGGADVGPAGPMIADFSSATAELDSFNFGPLHITDVSVDMKLRRSLRLAYLLKVVKAPSVMHRGRTYPVTVEIQRQNGAKSRRAMAVHVPRGMPAGRRTLTFEGTSPDAGAPVGDALTTILDLGSLDSGGATDSAGPRTVNGVAVLIERLHRNDGVTAAFLPAGFSPSDSQDGEEPQPAGAEAIAQRQRQVLRDKELRIAGTAGRSVLIVA